MHPYFDKKTDKKKKSGGLRGQPVVPVKKFRFPAKSEK